MEWYIPITIIPGAALLVLSTSNFIIALNNEIEALQHQKMEFTDIIIRKVSQVNTLSLAIASLYISIAFFTLSGMMLGLESINQKLVRLVSTSSLCLGLVTLFFGISLLILYAYRAVRIRKNQFAK